MPIRDRLRPVFVEALELEPGADIEGLQQRDEDRWDSLGHLALIAAIEEEFDVELEADQLVDMISFEQAIRFLQDLGVDDQ